jgi:hypothetical protein
MILYHGSSKRFDTLKPSQAQAGEGMAVPENELLEAVYATPDIGFAIAVAALPDNTAAHIDEATKIITFEHPELFDPKKDVYIYAIDTDTIPGEHLIKVDEQQYAITGLEAVTPVSVESMPAAEVLKYYEINGIHKESEPEVTSEIKLR